MGKQRLKRAKLFTCASCEWIFKDQCPEHGGCPKCNFGYYGAHYVYGDKAYQYQYTQKPWVDGKLAWEHSKLLNEVALTNSIKRKKPLQLIELRLV